MQLWCVLSFGDAHSVFLRGASWACRMSSGKLFTEPLPSSESKRPSGNKCLMCWQMEGCGISATLRQRWSRRPSYECVFGASPALRQALRGRPARRFGSLAVTLAAWISASSVRRGANVVPCSLLRSKHTPLDGSALHRRFVLGPTTLISISAASVQTVSQCPPQCYSARNQSYAGVWPASLRMPIVPSNPHLWTMCSNPCLLKCFVASACFSQHELERWVRCALLSIIVEARALMTCRCEPRHWISMVSCRMKKYVFATRLHLVVPPGCSSLIFLVCTIEYSVFFF